MKTSANGLRFIASWEGEVDHVYRDIAGVETVGIGHALRPGESFPDGITHEQALELLAQDVGTAETAINSAVTVPLSQNQFDALASFTFNLGTGALRSSALLHLLNGGQPDAAAEQFQLWCHIKKGGVMVADPGLLRRRLAEKALFLKPDPSTIDTAPELPDDSDPPEAA